MIKIGEFLKDNLDLHSHIFFSNFKSTQNLKYYEKIFQNSKVI